MTDRRAVAQEPKTGLLKIATYNVHSWAGTHGERDPRQALRVLREIDADIVATQEVILSRGTKGLDERNIAASTGMEMIPGPTLMKGDNHYGNAILTSHQPTAIRRLDLSMDGREPRGALDVTFVIQGVQVRLIATHLGLKGWERGPQVCRLLEALEHESSGIVVLLGDFNVWFPRSRWLRRIEEQFGEAPAPRTFPSWRPLLRLDRIWVRPRSRLVDLWVHRSPESVRASDHLPVVAQIELPGQ